MLKVAKKIEPTSHLSKAKRIFNNKANTLADCYKSEALRVEQLGSVHHMESVWMEIIMIVWNNFQHQKAKYCGARSIAYQIMHAADPVDMKKLGDSLAKDCWPKEIQMMETKKSLDSSI